MARRDLGTYRAKRDFGATPEPQGEASASRDESRFVVQEHHATRLHWDLRLERDGALASWAVPNGLPEVPNENRLAVRTEDHPLEYLEFHGEIPEGSYGAGTMTIWDRGTYETEKWEPAKVVVALHGERVRGRYALFQTRGQDWMIHRIDPPEDAEREPMPERIVPMLARLAPLPADDANWGYEIKWDGIRAIAYSRPGRLRLESRNLNDITAGYPELRPLNRALSHHEAVLDGEIVAFDDEGRPSFQRLQRRMHLTGEAAVRRMARSSPVVYVIFDLLFLDGHSLMELPYEERRARLAELALDGEHWRTPAHHAGDGAQLLAVSRDQGLEGIVAKRLRSPYEPGRRGGSWLKVKNTRRQELVIGGWQPGEGRRRNRLGALLVGYRDDGRLRFAGKVGTGFDERELDRLGELLASLERPQSPFGPDPPPPRGAHWVEPRLVAEIEFAEMTSQGILRHPSYKGLREDKAAAEVRLEAPGDDYYARIQPVLEPHLSGNDVDRRRAPDGTLELHVSPLPASLAFEVCPLGPADAGDAAAVALALHGMLEGLGLESYAKTSGAGGMGVFVPLNGTAGRDQARAFGAAVVQTLERGLPALQEGRVRVEPVESTLCVYSLRAGGSGVSTPVTWDELRDGEEGLEFAPEQVLARVEERGDLFAPVLSVIQTLPG